MQSGFSSSTGRQPRSFSAGRRAPAGGLSVLLVAALPLCAAGCGYSLGYRSPPHVATIAIPTFDNQTFPLRREIEYELTDAFRKEIQTRSGLILVDQRDGADMAVYGTIKRFEESVIANTRFDRKTESTIFIDVEMISEDYRNNKRRTQWIRDSEPLSIQSGETIVQARARAIRNLAQRMATQLEFWGA